MAVHEGPCGKPDVVKQEYTPDVTVEVHVTNQGKCPVVVSMFTTTSPDNPDRATIKPRDDRHGDTSHPPIKAYNVSKLTISCSRGGEHDNCRFSWDVRNG